MGISSAGMGSGIDIGALVTQLVAAESKPAYDAIQRRETSLQTEFTALGLLKNALSTYQNQIQSLGTAEFFNSFQVSSSDNTTVLVSGTSSAVAGSYTMQVTQLALAQKSISTAEYANESAIIGTGTLTFTSGSGATFSAVVGGTGTLSNICDAINEASDNFGVTASVVNVDSAITPGTTISKLVLTANKVGVANGFTQSGIVGVGGTTAIPLANQTTAQDAIIILDGQTATRGTNAITDVVDGLVLNLQKANPGTDIKLTVGQNTTVIGTAIANFVNGYNNFVKSMSDLTHIGVDSADRGPLAGDAGVRNLMNHIRLSLSAPVTSVTEKYNTLTAIGVTVDQTGVMSLDMTKLNQALTQSPNAVNALFSSTSAGIVQQINHQINPFVEGSTNIISEEQSHLEKQRQTLEHKRSDVKHRMDGLQQVLLKQYILMDQLVSKYKSISPIVENAFKLKGNNN
jgi:flagellar hook-associated protein 2